MVYWSVLIGEQVSHMTHRSGARWSLIFCIRGCCIVVYCLLCVVCVQLLVQGIQHHHSRLSTFQAILPLCTSNDLKQLQILQMHHLRYRQLELSQLHLPGIPVNSQML